MLKTYKITPILFLSLFLLSLFSAIPVSAQDLLDDPQYYLSQGNPDKAIQSAQHQLSSSTLSEDKRMMLLKLIAKAKFIIASARHYEDVSAAVEAIETLIKEFPDQVDEPELLSQIIDLYWNQNALEEAQASILDLQSRFPSSEQAQHSWLTLGKIHFINHHLAEARNAFLRFALNVPRQSANGRDVRMWTALVDYEEARYKPALTALNQIYQEQPELLTSKDNIFSRYIYLLAMQGEHQRALTFTKNFLKTFKTSTHSPEIRLLQADLMLKQKNPPIQSIVRAYSLLADKEADTVIGRKAFMRKLMIQMRDKKTYYDIKPAIVALKRMGNQNQMSDIEDEATFHEAQLWESVFVHDPSHSPKSAGEVALQQFTRASTSLNPNISEPSKAMGSQAFQRQIKSLIKQKEWLSAITLWKKFPNFRPPLQDSTQLRFDIARGLRLLMEYEQAEYILAQLQAQAQGSVWGEKVMLERARLWLDRRDSHGVQKVLQWLDKHEYTLYRPEMLVIVAHMQIQNKNATSASHTLDFVAPEDLTQDIKSEYWEVKALTSEALSRWHIAARAWRMFAKHNPKQQDQAQLNEANALFKGKDYLRAEQLYSQTPERLQTPAWQYRYSICQLKSGKWNQATQRLNALKKNKDAGIYTSMASLTLAEREADRLLKENP